MKRWFTPWIAMTCWAVIGCQSQVEPESAADLGRLQLPLMTTSASGAQYRLTGAQFAVTGASSVTLDGTVEADVVSAELPLGEYSVLLQNGWAVTRQVGTGPIETVAAELVSENPQTAELQQQQATTVAFKFRVGDDVIAFDRGRLRVTFEIDEPTPDVCMDRAVCLEGSVLISQNYMEVNGVPYTNVFGPVLGQTLNYRIGFDVVSESPGPGFTSYRTGPIGLTIDHAALGDFVRDLNGRTDQVITVDEFFGTMMNISCETCAAGSRGWGFEVQVPADPDGPLELGNHIDALSNVILRRYSPFSDFAAGGGPVSISVVE